ncbi:MAG TPA: hypothetical protein VIH61_08665 [Waddliaceae bacterium]
MKQYRDYLWKEGVPCGLQAVEESSGKTYKIVADPYRKWISLEEYTNGDFNRILYDSSLLDFRKLKPAAHTAWQKVTLKETSQETVSLIRDHNDRVILFEYYQFEQGYCRICRVNSPHGYPLSCQKIFRKELGDSFDGVILYDINEHPVMRKIYKTNSVSEEFAELIEENWNISLSNPSLFKAED